MPPALAVTGLARDVTLVLTLLVASSTAALMMGAVARTDCQMVLGAAIRAEDVLGALDVQFFEGHRLWYQYLNVEAILPALEWRTWAVVLHRNESYGADVQPFEGPARARPDGETALPAGEGLTVVVDFEKPSVGDRQAEAAVLAGPVCQRATVRADVPLFWFLAVGDGSGNAFKSLGAALLHPLIGFPSLFAAFLVDVVGRVGLTPVGLPLGDDPLVDGIGMAFPTAFWQGWFPVEHVNGVVVGDVLLGGIVADGPAVCRVVAQGEFQCADHLCLALNGWMRLFSTWPYHGDVFRPGIRCLLGWPQQMAFHFMFPVLNRGSRRMITSWRP